MKATLIYGPQDVRLEDVPDPVLRRPTDAIVRVVAACVCGSDLWAYRGINKTREPRRIGHEHIGIVEEVGAEVTTLRPGDFVVAPFSISDNTCVHCQHGVQTSCEQGLWYGSEDADGHLIDACQGELVRVPLADGTLVALESQPDERHYASLLACSDVMGTGWHAALAAGVQRGSTVAVVGDGAVGLCGVLAASLMGASRIIAMSRHEDRSALAREFGATDVVAERGDEGAERVKELTDGVGVDCVLECVGTGDSMNQAFASARPGGTVGFVGVPHGVEVPVGAMFGDNVALRGGVASVRSYIPDLVRRVLADEINPGRVFDLTLPLAEVAEAYAAMDERRAIKVMLRP